MATTSKQVQGYANAVDRAEQAEHNLGVAAMQYAAHSISRADLVVAARRAVNARHQAGRAAKALGLSTGRK